jgi:hypothetical protein
MVDVSNYADVSYLLFLAHEQLNLGDLLESWHAGHANSFL